MVSLIWDCPVLFHELCLFGSLFKVFGKKILFVTICLWSNVLINIPNRCLWYCMLMIIGCNWRVIHWILYNWKVITILTCSKPVVYVNLYCLVIFLFNHFQLDSSGNYMIISSKSMFHTCAQAGALRLCSAVLYTSILNVVLAPWCPSTAFLASLVFCYHVLR